ncbi:hypothetical protein RJT34_31795 [Clitoria ternatea]|uniref:Uncharacterized protein n=1 Tax=Clitoria ternatea TaxID=43366 RepID=A0AAN9I5A4_CLITE
MNRDPAGQPPDKVFGMVVRNSNYSTPLHWSFCFLCEDSDGLPLMYLTHQNPQAGGQSVLFKQETNIAEKVQVQAKERENQQPLSLTFLTNSHLEAISVFLFLSLSVLSPLPWSQKPIKSHPQLLLEPLLAATQESPIPIPTSNSFLVLK